MPASRSRDENDGTTARCRSGDRASPGRPGTAGSPSNSVSGSSLNGYSNPARRPPASALRGTSLNRVEPALAHDDRVLDRLDGATERFGQDIGGPGRPDGDEPTWRYRSGRAQRQPLDVGLYWDTLTKNVSSLRSESVSRKYHSQGSSASVGLSIVSATWRIVRPGLASAVRPAGAGPRTGLEKCLRRVPCTSRICHERICRWATYRECDQSYQGGTSPRKPRTRTRPRRVESLIQDARPRGADAERHPSVAFSDHNRHEEAFDTQCVACLVLPPFTSASSCVIAPTVWTEAPATWWNPSPQEPTAHEAGPPHVGSLTQSRSRPMTTAMTRMAAVETRSMMTRARSSVLGRCSAVPGALPPPRSA